MAIPQPPTRKKSCSNADSIETAPDNKTLGRIDCTYNAIGQLTEIYHKNAIGALVDDMFIEYDVTGKVTGVYKN